jgi:putative FmdB family regulatory protein
MSCILQTALFLKIGARKKYFMPIYEYFCKNCEKEFELLIRGTQKPVCPHCGGKKLDRWMSAPASPTHANGSNCPIERGSSDAASHCAHAGGCGGHCPH